MKIFTSNDRATRQGPAEWFTGTVWLDEIARGETPSRVRLFRVSFAPGARTAWHTHPVGQTLHVLTGFGLVQLDGGPIQPIHPGDTVIIAPANATGMAPRRTIQWCISPCRKRTRRASKSHGWNT
jgi:quercetin dioxygenase-like cupin family protein